MKIFLIFGDQLFKENFYVNYKSQQLLMIESRDICGHFSYHKWRLTLLLSAMRHKRDELREQGFKVNHIPLNEDFDLSYIEKLESFCRKNKVSEIHCFEKEDKFFRGAVFEFCQKHQITLKTFASPQFINSREDFKSYLSDSKKPFMKSFYEQSRKRFNILIDGNKKPTGGKWSFDDENRMKLPKGISVPASPAWPVDEITSDVMLLIEKNFPHFPGPENFLQTSELHFPVTRKQALEHLDHFLKNKLRDFGKYEDAISDSEDFIFHSLLSFPINIGLLTPKEVIERALTFAKENDTPVNSLEGFVRQILGWREFVRGIYNEFSEVYEGRNFFNHNRRLSLAFYTGTTGITPLDNVLLKVNRYGYAHHIERLMILSNLMLLLEVHPEEVHRYFNEMFIDSMDWVMGPNVYCMGQFSDGGIFATKPYLCGSNYILKMSNYKKDETWCAEVDALYWSFIYRKYDFFKSQPRLSMMANLIDKMDKKKLENHLKLADEVRERLTYI